MKIKNATSKHSPPHCAKVPRQKPNGSDFFVKGLLFCVVRCHMTTALLVFFSDPPWQMGWGVIIKALQQRHCMVVHYILW